MILKVRTDNEEAPKVFMLILKTRTKPDHAEAPRRSGEEWLVVLVVLGGAGGAGGAVGRFLCAGGPGGLLVFPVCRRRGARVVFGFGVGGCRGGAGGGGGFLSPQVRLVDLKEGYQLGGVQVQLDDNR